MIIRDYRPGDYPSVEALWRETGVYRQERGDGPETIQGCNDQGGRFLILEDESENIIVGTSWLTWDLKYLKVIMYI